MSFIKSPRFIFTFAVICFLSTSALLFQYDSFSIRSRSTHVVVSEVGTPRGPYASSYGKGTHWRDWANIDHVFIFGDSWTTTGFEIDDAQPTVNNPLGNPDWDPRNWHLGAGTNWVGFITAWHNASLLRTVNLAYGGATVDMDLIHPFEEIPPGMRDLGHQVNELFKPKYAMHPDYFNWTDASSLFVVWIGLNDIHNANANNSMRFGMVWEQFAIRIEQLYGMGARNFMFLSVPPIDKAPLAAHENMTDNWRHWVNAWNKNLTTLVSDLTHAHSDTMAFVFDTHSLYNDVLEDPCSFEATCAFKDTTTACVWYAWGTDEWDSKNENCTYRVDQYLWMNPIHPTTRMHNLTALQMAKALSADLAVDLQ
ncbi:carbohydrate esterase family 16 protein [Dothistroma septosporum NZE10]|uniref:Carbohydrate esterase family 16 protein n=1 Tax=Dothistroma septosporum (strain NZE10 / CBS 128990) TaxID=675120 RepID=N1PTS3_DOTSN|nr:carbohydrate esterase family 16 protein [Dothistroma septosporum NZE10]